MSFIYVASPYTHKEPSIRDNRYWKVLHFVAEHTRRGRILYSPIVHCHQMALTYELPGNLAFWKEHNTKLLRHANELWVYTLEGWKESQGVTFEIELANRLHIPIILCDSLPGWKPNAESI